MSAPTQKNKLDDSISESEMSFVEISAEQPLDISTHQHPVDAAAEQLPGVLVEQLNGASSEQIIEKLTDSPLDESIVSTFARLEEIMEVKTTVEVELDGLIVQRRNYALAELEKSKRRLNFVVQDEERMWYMVKDSSIRPTKNITSQTTVDEALTTTTETTEDLPSTNTLNQILSFEQDPPISFDQIAAEDHGKEHAVSPFEESIAATFSRLQDIVVSKKLEEKRLGYLLTKRRILAVEELEKAKCRLEFVTKEESRMKDVVSGHCVAGDESLASARCDCKIVSVQSLESGLGISTDPIPILPQESSQAQISKASLTVGKSDSCDEEPLEVTKELNFKRDSVARNLEEISQFIDQLRQQLETELKAATKAKEDYQQTYEQNMRKWENEGKPKKPKLKNTRVKKLSDEEDRLRKELDRVRELIKGECFADFLEKYELNAGSLRSNYKEPNINFKGGPIETGLSGEVVDRTILHGTSKSPFTETVEKNTDWFVGGTIHYKSISCMPQYHKWSPEELRVQDYAMGRKRPGSNAPFAHQTS